MVVWLCENFTFFTSSASSLYPILTHSMFEHYSILSLSIIFSIDSPSIVTLQYIIQCRSYELTLSLKKRENPFLMTCEWITTKNRLSSWIYFNCFCLFSGWLNTSRNRDFESVALKSSVRYKFVYGSMIYVMMEWRERRELRVKVTWTRCYVGWIHFFVSLSQKSYWLRREPFFIFFLILSRKEKSSE